MDGNKSAKLCVILFFAAVILLCLFFCFASFITSVGYKQSIAANFLSRQVIAQSADSYTFVIDPGHGGEDPGCVSGEHREKDLNLSISRYLYDFFALSNSNAVMTRSDDRLLYGPGQENRKKFYDLRNRLNMAENVNNGVYVGIHINKFPVARYHGLQTFYSDNVPESRNIALSVQESARIIDPENERVIKPDGNTIYILEKIQIPAILIECGFISNEKEVMLLEDKDYQKRLAFVIFCGIERWLGGKNEE